MDQTIKKANSTLGFLRRNMRVSNEETKSTAYYSMVRPILQYCSTDWNPYTKDHIHNIEMVQRRAARYVTNRYRNTSSVTAMLEHLELETLETRRAKHQLIMLFKVINGIVDNLTPASSRKRCQHSLKFRQIHASSDYYKFSFFPRTVRHWNCLPVSVAEAPSLVSFTLELYNMSM